jgi:hypothetical protein
MSAMTTPPTPVRSLGRRYSHLLTFMVDHERRKLEQSMVRLRKSTAKHADSNQQELSREKTDQE